MPATSSTSAHGPTSLKARRPTASASTLPAGVGLVDRHRPVHPRRSRGQRHRRGRTRPGQVRHRLRHGRLGNDVVHADVQQLATHRNQCPPRPNRNGANRLNRRTALLLCSSRRTDLDTLIAGLVLQDVFLGALCRRAATDAAVARENAHSRGPVQAVLAPWVKRTPSAYDESGSGAPRRIRATTQQNRPGRRTQRRGVEPVCTATSAAAFSTALPTAPRPQLR